MFNEGSSWICEHFFEVLRIYIAFRSHLFTQCCVLLSAQKGLTKRFFAFHFFSFQKKNPLKRDFFSHKKWLFKVTKKCIFMTVHKLSLSISRLLKLFYGLVPLFARLILWYFLFSSNIYIHSFTFSSLMHDFGLLCIIMQVKICWGLWEFFRHPS